MDTNVIKLSIILIINFIKKILTDIIHWLAAY